MATIILCPAVFKYSNAGLIFLMFWLLGFTCLGYSTLMTAFFSKARTAVVFALLVFFVSYFVSFSVDDRNIDESKKNAASLLPLTAFSLSLGNLSKFEIGGSGIQLDNATD